jgi:transposase
VELFCKGKDGQMTTETTTLAQREEIGKRWENKETDRQIAQAMGLSMATVRKWRRKYARQGRFGLASRRGRPASGALGQYSQALQEAIKEMREKQPGWGALTLRVELELDPKYAETQLPSRSRIAAFLKEKNLSRQYDRHSHLPETLALKAKAVHEEWEIDAQGEQEVAGLGKVSIINIGDLVSRLKVDSFACFARPHPDTLDYQFVLRRAFITYGMPQRISLDHDSVYYDNGSSSPFPTTLHLWLMALGIEARFITKPPPLEHSQIERQHQTISAQAIYGQTYEQESDLQKSLQKRLEFLNYAFPSSSLGGQAPLQAFAQAKHSGRTYQINIEESLLDMNRVYSYLEKGKWFRRASTQGQVSLGAQRYNAGMKFKNSTLEITFDPQTLQFVALSEDATQTIRFTPTNLTKQSLIGDLRLRNALPAHQLLLPFTPDAIRLTLMDQPIPGTIL